MVPVDRMALAIQEGHTVMVRLVVMAPQEAVLPEGREAVALRVVAL